MRDWRCTLALTALLLPSMCYAWLLNVSTDEMTGKQSRSVSALSENQTTLKWPYGTINARLVVRNHPRYGKDVLFVADKGHIPCHSFDPCTVLVRFDDNAPMRFSGNGPSDGSTEVIFIEGYARFTKAMAKAKSARIEVEFYQDGRRPFTFDVSDFANSGLTTPPAKKK